MALFSESTFRSDMYRVVVSKFLKSRCKKTSRSQPNGPNTCTYRATTFKFFMSHFIHSAMMRISNFRKLFQKVSEVSKTKTFAISLQKFSAREIFRQWFVLTVNLAGTQYLHGVALTWLEQGYPPLPRARPLNI